MQGVEENECSGLPLELRKSVGLKLYALFIPVIMMPPRLQYFKESRYLETGKLACSVTPKADHYW